MILGAARPLHMTYTALWDTSACAELLYDRHFTALVAKYWKRENA